jgi:hypothetical protein
MRDAPVGALQKSLFKMSTQIIAKSPNSCSPLFLAYLIKSLFPNIVLFPRQPPPHSFLDHFYPLNKVEAFINYWKPSLA